MRSVWSACILLAWVGMTEALLMSYRGLSHVRSHERSLRRFRLPPHELSNVDIVASNIPVVPPMIAEMGRQNMTQLAARVIDAIQAGNLAELQALGMGVQDAEVDCNALEEKIFDPEVQQKVFGDVECDPEVSSRLAVTTLSNSAPLRREVVHNPAAVDLVIDDVDEELLAKMRTRVTPGSASVGIAPSIGDVSLNRGQNAQMSQHNPLQEDREDAAGSPVKGDAEVVFTQLLKATMTEQERNTGINEALATATVSSVQREGFSVADLDLRAILGETMHSIAESLGIDVQEEIAGAKLQSIAKRTATELGADLQRLGSESDRLYAALRSAAANPAAPADSAPASTMSAPLTYAPDGELGVEAMPVSPSNGTELLQPAMEAMRASTVRMQRVLGDLNENADLLTTLVMFPLRSADKKAAFVLGLALLFKVPFDVLTMWTVRDLGNTQDWTLLAAQLALSVACFQHFGLWKAMLISYSDRFKS